MNTEKCQVTGCQEDQELYINSRKNGRNYYMCKNHRLKANKKWHDRKFNHKKIKIGIGFAVLNNFKGFAEAVHSINTRHDWNLYMFDQWRLNRPLAQTWNQMAMRAFSEGCDYALICNDDILFSPNCIDAMVQVHQELNKDGVVMVTPNNIALEIADPYQILSYELPEGTPPSHSDHPNFSCFLIARDYFEKVGFFDENFIPAWYEDNDSHYRAQLLGYREVCTNLAPMVHIGGVSTSMMENPNSANSHAYYIKKWGSCNRTGEENYKTPYGDPAFRPDMWRAEDGTVVGPLQKQGELL